MKTPSTTADQKWGGLMRKLKDNGVEYFLNSQLEPTVNISEDDFQHEWPVDSQRFTDLVIALSCEITNGQMLPSTDLKLLQCLIREECRRGGRRVTEGETAKIEEDPNLQTILVFMNGHSEFDDLTANLLEELHKIQERNLMSMSREITFFTNIFSRQLGRLIPALRGYGVETSFRHEEDGSHVNLKRTELFQCEPAQAKVRMDTPDGTDACSNDEPSAASLLGVGASERSDDSDGRTERPRTEIAEESDVNETSEGGEI